MSDDSDEVLSLLGADIYHCQFCGEREEYKSGWSILETLSNGEIDWIDGSFCCSSGCVSKLIEVTAKRPGVSFLSPFPNSEFGDLP